MIERNKIYCGNAYDILRDMPAESVDCIFTSPPYYAKRNYHLESIIWGGSEACDHVFGEQHEEPGDLKFRAGINAQVGNAKSHDIYYKDKPEFDPWRDKRGIKYIHKKGETNPGKESWYKEQDAAAYLSNCFCMKCGAWIGNLGHEPDPQMYIEHLMMIFNECKRVLKRTGSMYVNIGETYGGYNSITKDMRGKSQLGIPFSLALAMLDGGWKLRNTIIWHKTNAMPESARDRFTNDFEFIFFFVKNTDTVFYTNYNTCEITYKKPERYIENIDWKYKQCPACKGKGCDYCGDGKVIEKFWQAHDYYYIQQFKKFAESTIIRARSPHKSKKGDQGVYPGLSNAKADRWCNKVTKGDTDARNMRTVWSGFRSNVWSIGTKAYHGAHFAVFPADLADRVIKSSCPELICERCGLPEILIKGNVMRCGCDSEKLPGIILDPFAGAGTLGISAKKLKRDYILIDTSPEFCKMAKDRING